jgi:transcriptional regulator with GAF, ATPase, and Fis domain
MKRYRYLTFNTAFLLPVVFFAGIAATSFALYAIHGSLPGNHFQLLCITLGITLLAGALAINQLAGNKEVKIVYREKLAETAEAGHTSKSDEVNLIDIESIRQGMEGSYESVQKVLNILCNQLQAGQGAIYTINEQHIELKYGYALAHDRNTSVIYEFGEGLVGRVAAQNEMLCLDKLPDNYITVYSGLGSASPTYLLLLPIGNDSVVKGVLEIATFHSINGATLEGIKAAATMLGEEITKEKRMDYAA